MQTDIKTNTQHFALVYEQGVNSFMFYFGKWSLLPVVPLVSLLM